jgi:alkanesulfonate monooxygenase SsuD/methylene tetrahydromethanopterin reductase-like flavin-dependent oxidoreductase (luciferase family)
MGMSLKDGQGRVHDATRVAERARWVEAAGFDSIWMGDGLPSMARPDILQWLLVAGSATERLEIGTSIYIVPMRHPIDLAQRFLTIGALLPGRVSLGVGTGSEWEGHLLMGSSFDDRFKRLYASMETIRQLCEGASAEEASPGVELGREPSSMGGQAGRPEPWGKLVEAPRFLLGGYHSNITLRRAAREYDGWIGSSGRTSFATLAEAIARYRDLGGRRAVVSSISVDLDAPTNRVTDDDPYNLLCEPAAAAERLHRLAELGFDDVFLVKQNVAHRRPFYETDFTMEDLVRLRELVPHASVASNQVASS